MKKLSTGRKVDLSGINIQDVVFWLKSNKCVNNVIKCQAIVSLSKGNSMQNVCAVLGITRESVRKWKQKLRKDGIAGLVAEKKVGKRSKISIEHQRELRLIFKQKPKKYGFEKNKWSGVIVQKLIETKWNISIGARAAQIWIQKLK